MSPVGSIPIIGSNCRQIVSSSAPTSSLDMETLVRNVNQDVGNDPDFYRDRRKKDIHNMSAFIILFRITLLNFMPVAFILTEALGCLVSQISKLSVNSLNLHDA